MIYAGQGCYRTGSQDSVLQYLIPGNGFLLLGNEILHQSCLLGPENPLVIPAGVRGISRKESTLQTYCTPFSLEDKDARRTYIFIVLSKTSTLNAYFATHRTFFEQG